MFQIQRKRTALGSGFALLELIYHSTVREIRKGHRNAVIGLLMSMVQTVIFVAAFYLMFALIGVRGSSIPGADYLLYLMSGIFLFMIHVKAVSAVASADGPASAMMQHAPLNPLVAIASAAIAALYLQLLSIFTLLFLYHAIWTPVTVDDPAGAMMMILLAWFSGVSVGVLLYAIKPWTPEVSTILTSIWSRANMVFSGKMFVANSLPGHLLPFFAWNPLFHIIDESRGYVFLNYTPHYTDWRYAFWVSIVVMVIGLLAENFTRRRASASWGAGR